MLIEKRQCPVAEVGSKRETEERWVVSVLPFLLLAKAWYPKSFDHDDPGTANDPYAHLLGCLAW